MPIGQRCLFRQELGGFLLLVASSSITAHRWQGIPFAALRRIWRSELGSAHENDIEEGSAVELVYGAFYDACSRVQAAAGTYVLQFRAVKPGEVTLSFNLGI